MTAPLHLLDEARLAAVAAWDVPPVRGAVAMLGAVGGRLPVWHARLADVARALESADCWSGPAARSAVSAVYDLSTVATAVDAALQASLEEFERMAREADAAQEHATEALAMARALPGGLTAPPPAHSRLAESMSDLLGLPAPDPGPALGAAEAALRSAAAAAAAATAAGTALAGLGVRDAFAPADFWDLAGRISLVGPVAPTAGPSGNDPQEVAAWWAGLSAGAQVAALRAAPGAIGGLDGVPAWARDRANRLVLDRAGRDGRSTAATTARAVAERIAIDEAAGRDVQLHLLNLEAEQVVLVLGDLDTAEAVGVLVPGVNNSPDDLPGLVGDARDIATAALGADPDVDVASVVWLGYASPDNLIEMGRRAAASDGGPHLAAALGGMAAARAAGGIPQPRTTVLAHSYGTVVVDEAADAPGRLAADAVVLLGSPGMEREGAGSLEIPEVYDAASAGDPISWFGYYGSSTWAPAYGSTGLPVDRSMGHSDYYDPAFPTLAAIGGVVAGVRPSD